MSSKVTIYDVAHKARVSLATVSRVLNSPDKVKPETRDKVNKVIKELGYRANAIARGLASRKTTTVGVIVSDITRASVSEMLDGICDIAKKYKYTIKLFTINSYDDKEDIIRGVLSEQVDGVLYLNDELEEEDAKHILKEFNDNNISVVFCNVMYDLDVPTIGIDYEKACYEMTKKLIDKGRKNISFVTTRRIYSTNNKKEIGYLKAIEEANLQPNILRTSGDVLINRPFFKEVIEKENIDAAVCVRDSIAVSFINSSMDVGKEVPKDIMVTGFQNTKYALLSRPLLSCVHIPVYDIGAVSMRLLTKYMLNEEIKQTSIKLPHEIIERESTKGE